MQQMDKNVRGGNTFVKHFEQPITIFYVPNSTLLSKQHSEVRALLYYVLVNKGGKKCTFSTLYKLTHHVFSLPF